MVAVSRRRAVSGAAKLSALEQKREILLHARHPTHIKMLASPGWLYLRETQYGEEHFAQPTQQHLIALDSEQGLLKYFPLATGPGTQLLEALGTLSLIGASITALDGVAACRSASKAATSRT